MTLKLFQKKIEDFTCLHCGEVVRGDGYTNHCPVCLWSQHVDVNPGDRQAECKGMMKPVKIETVSANEFTIVHICQKCGFKRKNKVQKKDNFDTVLKIAKNK